MRNVGNQEKKKREARNVVVRMEHTTGAIYHPEIQSKALFVNNTVTITTCDVSLKIMYPVYPSLCISSASISTYLRVSSFSLTCEAVFILDVTLAALGLGWLLREEHAVHSFTHSLNHKNMIRLLS